MMSAGGPGSKSNITMVGDLTFGYLDNDVCNSRSARFGTQTSVGKSLAMQKQISA